MSASTTHDNLPAVLRLAGEILKEATLPESEFEEIRKEQLTELDFGKTDRRPWPSLEIAALYPFPKGDVRATMSIPRRSRGSEERQAGGAKASIKLLWRLTVQLAVVGDFDPAAVKKEIEALFGNWKSLRIMSASSTAFRKSRP